MSVDLPQAYIVVAYRWGHRDNHSYVVGCCATLEQAKELAESHVEWRGGKYGCEVVECPLVYDGQDGESQAKQVHYVESNYYGKAGRHSPSEHPADKNKPLDFGHRFVCGKCFDLLPKDEQACATNSSEWATPEEVQRMKNEIEVLKSTIRILTGTPSGNTEIRVPLRWDSEVEEWILTPEAHQMLDGAKTKRGSPDPDPITR